MCVGIEKMEDWLNICREIASDCGENSFAEAAIELAKETSESGKSYVGVVQEYRETRDVINSLKKEQDECVIFLDLNS